MATENPDTTGTWERVDRALQTALDQPSGEREDWVRAEYADDPALRDAVLKLLASESDSKQMFKAAMRERDTVAAAALESDGSFDLVGSRLGAYRIKALIATGGMGAVYRAERDDGEFKQTVAIKILPAWATNPNTVARLRAERQILSTLQHPNITQLIDGGQTGDGFPYLVTQFIDGLPITEHVAKKQLSLAERLELFVDVVNTVQYTHEMGVVHRDIKPANILIDANGHPQLLDFGIAKLRDGVLDPVTGLRTATGFSPMTPEYASPEQVASGEVGIASDIYQLGLLLYQIVTGKRLSVSDTSSPAGVTRPSTAVVRGDTDVSPSGLESQSLARELKGDVDTIILKALRPEPEHRYRSARALARDLRHYLDGEAIEARPQSLYSASRRLGRQYPVAATLAVGLVAMLAIWAASLSFYTQELEQQRDEADLQARRATQAKDVLIDVFRRSDPLQGDSVGGRGASVWDSLSAAEEEARDTLADDPALLAELLATLSGLQGYAGEQERMLSLLEESAALYAELGPRYAPEYSVQLAELANQLTNSDVERAQRLRDEVNLLLPEIQSDHPLAAATVLVDIGSIDFTFGNFERSLEAHDQVLAILESESSEDWSLQIEAHFGRGKALTSLERLDEAAAELKTSLELTREHFGDDHGRITGTLSALSTLEGRRGNQVQSIRWAEQLVALMSKHNAPEYPGLLNARNNLALAYRRVGQPREEQAILRDIIRIRREVFGSEGDRNLGGNLKNLASSLHYTGDLEEAREAVLEARKLINRFYPDGSPITATPWFTLGLIELDRGFLGEAEAAFQETLSILIPALGEKHVQIHITRCFMAESQRQAGKPEQARSLAGPALAGILAAPSANLYYASRCQKTQDALNSAVNDLDNGPVTSGW